MKLKRVFMALAMALGVVAACSSAKAQTIQAKLDGYQVVSTQSTLGTGSFRAKVDRENKTIEYELSYQNLEGNVLQSHIHFGRPGTNGGIVLFLCTNLGNTPASATPAPLCPGPHEGTVTGILRASDVVFLPFQGVLPQQQLIEPGEFDEVVRAIDAGAAYVVVHTSAQPPGELRGNIGGRGERHGDED